MRIGIDIGGTFTDFVLFDETSGQFETFKVLSTPKHPEQAVLAGLERVHGAVWSIIHGSTVATNTLLERKGARTAFITTRGFRDLLSIGRQVREHIYDFFTDRPTPLVPPECCFEITERVDYQGRVLTPLAKEELPALIKQLRSQQIESVAISLLFSFLHPEHEQWLASSLREAGFLVSPSCEILPEFREYERASTTAINAYVSPILDRYIGRLEKGMFAFSPANPSLFPGGGIDAPLTFEGKGDWGVSARKGMLATDFRIMQSNGGSIRADQARSQAVRSILSGPAGGVVGAFYVAQAANLNRVITFDMGGTSTDVCLLNGKIRVTSEAEIAGLPIRIPVIDIHTVGSGGGSIAYVDLGGALRVGPQSAGSDPGPICYGRGGQQPTVTDANLLLGRLAPDYFLGGQMALDVEGATEALTKLAQKANLSARPGLTLAQTAALGVIQVANVHMERALRVISVQRGYDPRDFGLVSFGGAGALHACDLARSLGIKQVLIPPAASTLSAFGMLTADVVKDYVQTVMLPGSTSQSELEPLFASLVERGQREVMAEGIPAEQIILHRELDIRYLGQSYELTVPLISATLDSPYQDDFHRIHQLTYGYNRPAAPLEIVNIRLRAVGHVTPPPLQGKDVRRLGQVPGTSGDPSEALKEHRSVVLSTKEHPQGVVANLPFYLGERLRPDHVIAGPAVVVQKDTSVFLSAGDQATVDRYGNFVINVTS